MSRVIAPLAPPLEGACEQHEQHQWRQPQHLRHVAAEGGSRASSPSAHAPQSSPEEHAEESHAALKLLPHAAEDMHARRALPLLATAGDVREVVQFLKKKPSGVTVVEAMDITKRRVFEPRKVTAYEFWGLVEREGDRLRLSPLGWEFARRLEPEARAYRTLLDQTDAYRSVLVWIHERGLQTATQSDVAAFWHERHAEVLEGDNEKTIAGNVVCFFHLCQAAELGTLTIGKRGQLARLRVDREELQNYVEGRADEQLFTESVSSGGELMSERAAGGETRSARRAEREVVAPPAPAPVRVLLSCAKRSKLVEQIEETLQLAGIVCEVAERDGRLAMPMPDDALAEMRGCDAALVVLDDDDFQANGDGESTARERVLVEIGAAYVLYNRRLVLLWSKQSAFPQRLKDLPHYEIEEGNLSWETGLQLMKTFKEFEGRARRDA